MSFKTALDDSCQNATEIKIEKRNAIFKAAIDVFAEFGYQSADVQEIANRAGVGKGTVYRYFINKEQLFWATSLYVIQCWCEPLIPILESQDNAAIKLRNLTIERSRFFENYPNCIEVMALQRAQFRGSVPEDVHEYLHCHFFDPIMKIITDGVARGELQIDDPNAFFFTYCTATYGATITYCHFGKFIGLTEMTKLAVDTMLNGVKR
ncbi:MAG: TetR/AcrR family transcriptional regulator [Planctomycetaceae bacterium]|jgi:AcrR family transcriptional regulator|nr:TetR/AcrR family transcriptional regulator [Planctomycetaceae bacterium]